MRILSATPLLVLALVLAGCSEPDLGSKGLTSAAERSAAAASVDRDPCPEKLPNAPAPTHGHGTPRPAEDKPQLPAPEAAWVCVYEAFNTTETTGSGGTILEWVRTQDRVHVDHQSLTQIRPELDRLVPVARDRACRADLGPRYVLIYAHGDSRVGVSVDDFGCQVVRLTDDPFNTVFGEATEHGTESGVLTSATNLLALLKTIANSPPN